MESSRTLNPVKSSQAIKQTLRDDSSFRNLGHPNRTFLSVLVQRKHLKHLRGAFFKGARSFRMLLSLWQTVRIFNELQSNLELQMSVFTL